MDRRGKSKKAKVQANRPLARKSAKGPVGKVSDLEKRLAEALEQQTATSEILRVISSSPTDDQPVFDSLVTSAARLCGANDLILLIREANVLRPAAGVGSFWQSLAADFRVPLVRGTVAARSVIDGATLHFADLATLSEAEFPVGRDLQRRFGHHTALAVPLMREGVALGTIFAMRFEVQPFVDQQVALLQTFADQAVIAIENVRLFKELEARNRDLTEALDQQTATAEILRVISTSPTDLQPVLDTVVASAARFCGAYDVTLFQVDGDRLRFPAHYGPIPVPEEGWIPLMREHVSGRAVLERRVVHLADVQAEAADFPDGAAHAQRHGHRTIVAAPLLREGAAIGALLLRRVEVSPFSDKQISLLQTFADQAVIAIENVRLFTELEGRNRDLTATSEILRVISSSPTDVQPVFDAIARSAAALCRAPIAGVFHYDGELVHFVSATVGNPEVLEAAHRAFPMRPSREVIATRAIAEGRVVHLADVLEDEGVTIFQRPLNQRSLLSVPMMRKGRAIGAINLARTEVGLFSDQEVALLKTFADQAVIAVENVRLFKELQARTGELTRSVEQLTALGEVSRAVSSTLDVETVLDTIVSRATQLAGADGCAISEYDDATELFQVRATHGIDAALVGTLRAMPLRKGEGAMGRATETREPIQIADIAVPGAYQGHLRDVLLGAGFRALLSVPLLREEQIIGSLSLSRNAPGEYSSEVIEVLKTFATQSALAIQNARLFREIADKSRQIEAASRHKSEFLANMSHELRTPLNAIIGFSEILAEKMFGDINEKQTEYLHDILESGRHLLSLINDILDLSKVEAGRMELELSGFDLPSAIENALILVRERASRRGITLGRTIDERLGTLRGDERKVKQVLLNLLSNALKFTPEGGRIDVSARAQDGVAEIAVTDTGVGIAPEDQEAIFEEFRQVGTADKKVEGTGLGLALSRKFIELHGGRIWVKSDVGQGSTFTFTLPERRVTEENAPTLIS